MAKKAAKAAKKMAPAKKAGAKKSAKSQDFEGMHGINPELVALMDYMISVSGYGPKGVTVGEVLSYAKNILSGASQLESIFGKKATLDKIAKLTSEELDEMDFTN